MRYPLARFLRPGWGRLIVPALGVVIVAVIVITGFRPYVEDWIRPGARGAESERGVVDAYIDRLNADDVVGLSRVLASQQDEPIKDARVLLRQYGGHDIAVRDVGFKTDTLTPFTFARVSGSSSSSSSRGTFEDSLQLIRRSDGRWYVYSEAAMHDQVHP